MSRSVISTANAPAAIGTYSQAVKAGNTVYLSGQIGLDPASMEMREGFDAQTEQVFRNLKAVAEAAGGSLGDAVKLTIYLTDLADFPAVTKVWGEFYTGRGPGRTTVGVNDLTPSGLRVEMTAFAVRGA